MCPQPRCESSIDRKLVELQISWFMTSKWSHGFNNIDEVSWSFWELGSRTGRHRISYTLLPKRNQKRYKSTKSQPKLHRNVSPSNKKRPSILHHDTTLHHKAMYSPNCQSADVSSAWAQNFLTILQRDFESLYLYPPPSMIFLFKTKPNRTLPKQFLNRWFINTLRHDQRVATRVHLVGCPEDPRQQPLSVQFMDILWTRGQTLATKSDKQPNSRSNLQPTATGQAVSISNFCRQFNRSKKFCRSMSRSPSWS